MAVHPSDIGRSQEDDYDRATATEIRRLARSERLMDEFHDADRDEFFPRAGFYRVTRQTPRNQIIEPDAHDYL